MPTPKETERKVREISVQAGNPKAGEEMATFQRGQMEMQSISQQQQNLLREQAMRQQMRARENQVLAQAGELGVMSAVSQGSTQQLATQVSQMNPQTQAVMARYGVKPGKPSTQTQRSQTQTITPQKVQITNNTTTTTKNDIKITQPGAPSTPKVVAAGAAGAGAAATVGKFRTWLSNVFARQREEDQVRAKEYQRKEWSLSHSASRMMRGLEKLGKTFADRLDPRKLTRGNMTTIKMLSTLMTISTLATYWPKILETVDKIGAFFGVGKGVGGKFSFENSGLYQMLKTFLGGKDGEGLGESFVKYFWAEGERDKNGQVRNQGIINYLIDKFKAFFSERADAVSQIKFPSLDFSGTGNSIVDGLVGFLKPVFSNLGAYLKDIFSAMLNGKSALSAIAERNATSNFISSITGGRNSSSEASTHKEANHYNDLIKGEEEGEKVFRGDRAVFLNKGGKKQNFLNEDDISNDGVLKNNIGSSARLSASLIDYARGNNTDNIPQLITGLSLLQKNAAGFEDGVTVDEEFIKGLVDTYDLDPKYLKQKRAYKLVKLDKDESEIYDKNSTESFADRINNSWFGSFWKNAFTAGNYSKAKYEQGIAEAERFKEEDSSHKVYRFVPLSYPAESIDGKEYNFNYLTYQDFEDIHNDLDRKAGITRSDNDTFAGKFTNSDHDFSSGILKYVSGKKANQAIDNVSQQMDLNLYQAKLDSNTDPNAIHTGEIKTLDENKLREDIKSRLSRDEFIDRAWKYGGLDKDDKYLDLMPGPFGGGDKKAFEKYKDELYNKYIDEQVANAKFLYNNLTEEEKNSGKQSYKYINGQAVSYNGNKYAQKWADGDITEWYEFPTQSETFSGTLDDWQNLADSRKQEAIRRQLQLDATNAQAANQDLGLSYSYLTNKNISTALAETGPTEKKNISNSDTLKLKEDIIRQKGWEEFYDFNKHEFKPYNSFTKDKLSKRKEAEEGTQRILTDVSSYISSNPNAGKHYFENNGVTIDTKKYGTVEEVSSTQSQSSTSGPNNSFSESTRAAQGAINGYDEYIAPTMDKIFGRTSDNRISGSHRVSEASMESINSIRELLRNGLEINDTAISGVIGNLYRESGLNPAATNPTSNAQGIAQWLGSRKTELESYYRTQTGKSAEVKDIPLQYQMEFMIQEAKRRKQLMEELKKIPNDHSNDSVVRAADIWLRGFEFGSDNKMLSKDGLQRATASQGGYNAFQGKGAAFALDIDQRSSASGGYNSNVNLDNATYSGFTLNNNSDVVGWIRNNVQGKHNTYTVGAGFKATGDNEIQTDCSSMAAKAYKEITGYNIGSNTGEQIKKGAWVDAGGVKKDSTVYNPNARPNEELLQPGDLLFYRKNGELDSIHKGRDYGVGHVEVYIGNGEKIGTGGTKDVNPTPLDTLPGDQTYIGAKRYVDSKGTAASNLTGGPDTDNSINLSSSEFQSSSSESKSGLRGILGTLGEALNNIFDGLMESFDNLAEYNKPEYNWHNLTTEQSKEIIATLGSKRGMPFTEDEIKSKFFADELSSLDPENEYIRVWSSSKPGEFFLQQRKKRHPDLDKDLLSPESVENDVADLTSGETTDESGTSGEDITSTSSDLSSLGESGSGSGEENTTSPPEDWKTLTDEALNNTIASLEDGPDGNEFFKEYYQDRTPQGLARLLSKYDPNNDYKAEVITSSTGKRMYVFKRRPKNKAPELTQEQRRAAVTQEILASEWEKRMGVRPDNIQISSDILSSGSNDLSKSYDLVKNSDLEGVMSDAEIFTDCTKALIAAQEEMTRIVLATGAQVAQNTPTVVNNVTNNTPQMAQPYTT